MVTKDVIMRHRVGIDSGRKNENRVLAIIDTIPSCKWQASNRLRIEVTLLVAEQKEARSRGEIACEVDDFFRDGVLE